MNAVAVLGSLMSLYRSADCVKSALSELIDLYRRIDPTSRVILQQAKGSKAKQKVRQRFSDQLDLDKQYPSFVANGANPKPEEVFKHLKDAFKQFELAFRNFHDYADIDGERTINEIVKITTVCWFYYPQAPRSADGVLCFRLYRDRLCLTVRICLSRCISGIAHI